jgi:hypothetical protein
MPNATELAPLYRQIGREIVLDADRQGLLPAERRAEILAAGPSPGRGLSPPTVEP